MYNNEKLIVKVLAEIFKEGKIKRFYPFLPQKSGMILPQMFMKY